MNAKHLFTKFLLQTIETEPFTSEWRFGYYTEYLSLEKEGDMIRVHLSLESWDEYEDGTNSFTTLVTPSRLADFLDNRLSEETYATVNNKNLNMKQALEDFTDILKQEAQERNAKANLKKFTKDLPKLKALMPSSETITWTKPDDHEEFERLYGWELMLEYLEVGLRKPTNQSYVEVLEELTNDEPDEYLELLTNYLKEEYK